jgi:dienelactone hydrolase
VEAGKAVGFPKFISDIDIKRSFGNHWKVEVWQQGKALVDIVFDPVQVTKSSQFVMPANGDDWLIVGKDGLGLKAVMTDLAPSKRPKGGVGWMTVNAQASPWKELVQPGSRAAATSFDTKVPRKLHLYPMTDVEVSADVNQMLDKIADAWAREDMKAVLENYHPAFKATNQKDLANMRRLYNLSRRYEWKVKDFHADGDFAYLKGEVQTDAGAFPVSARLLKEDGRWFFYGDGGSMKDKELAIAATGAQFDSFDAFMTRQAQEVFAAKDDLRFDTVVKELGTFTSIGNAIFKPEGKGPFPALVLLHGCGGIYEKGMRQWIAAALKQGYAVMAVDSMRGHATNCVAPLKVSTGQRIKDAYDALDHLRKLPSIDSKRVAVVGFSQGGAVALLLASQEFSAMYAPQSRFAAVAAVYPLCYFSARYGKYDTELLRTDIDTPLLVLMGGEDTYTPAYDCLFNFQKLQGRGAPVDWHIFPQATYCWDTPELSGKRTVSFRGDVVGFTYDPAASAESRQRLFDFLDRRLAKPQ